MGWAVEVKGGEMRRRLRVNLSFPAAAAALCVGEENLVAELL